MEPIIYPCGDEGGVIVPPQSSFDITENGTYNIEHYRFVNVDVGEGCCNVKVATTEEWNAQPDLIGEKDVVYVYTDRSVNADGDPIPGFKVGDGLAYLIDQPFNNDLSMRHINDSTVHITEGERLFWNNKVTAYINALDQEELVFSKM